MLRSHLTWRASPSAGDGSPSDAVISNGTFSVTRKEGGGDDLEGVYEKAFGLYLFMSLDT
jgi:hypothetical protein